MYQHPGSTTPCGKIFIWIRAASLNFWRPPLSKCVQMLGPRDPQNDERWWALFFHVFPWFSLPCIDPNPCSSSSMIQDLAMMLIHLAFQAPDLQLHIRGARVLQKAVCSSKVLPHHPAGCHLWPDRLPSGRSQNLAVSSERNHALVRENCSKKAIHAATGPGTRPWHPRGTPRPIWNPQLSRKTPRRGRNPSTCAPNDRTPGRVSLRLVGEWAWQAMIWTWSTVTIPNKKGGNQDGRNAQTSNQSPG